ncbi:MAG: ATP-binding cassette domain-containing protein [Pseudomonadales bacterium]
MAEPVPIVLENVSYYYGKGSLRKQILHNIGTSIQAGEIVILTGPSGSGKTTLLTLIGALRSAQDGSVKVLGSELRGANEKQLVQIRRQIGYIFQQHNLLESLTVAQNIQMALELTGEPSRKGWTGRIETVLDQVGMLDHIHKLPSELSGGQKQRIGIARALVSHPKIILADEPTASLDKKSGRDVVEIIQRLAKEEGAAVILVTHDNRILDVADRILHLEDGRVKSLADAVGDNTSRMLNILARHEPNSSSYLAAFALALTRVASADQVVTENETQAIRNILTEMSDLSSGEVDLVMELSHSLVGAHRGHVHGSEMRDRTSARHRNFVKALHAVAAADGEVSEAEETEIQGILSELGIHE